MDEHKFFHKAVGNIRERYGKESIIRMSDDTIAKCPAISTGCLSIDIASGIGGLPKGRITEIYGPPGSGKTSLALQSIVQAQKEGLVAIIDAEQSLDFLYASKLGVNVDDIFVSQPESGEEALSIAETLVRSGDIAMLVIDSVDALVPQKVIEGEIGDSLPASQARLMSQAMRMLKGVVRKSKTVFVCINQTRSDMGSMGGGYGAPRQVTSGGRALLYYSSMRIEVTRIGTVKDGDDQSVANKVKIEFKKNKVAVPYKRCEVELRFGEGFDIYADLLDLGVACKEIEKSGSWYAFNGERLGQGRAFSVESLKANPEMMAKITASVRQKKGLDILPEESEEGNNE